MAKKQNSQIIIAAVIIAIVIIIGGNQGWFKQLGDTYSFVNSETITQLDTKTQGVCSIDITPDSIIEGDLITGTIIADPSTFCEIYGTDGSGWRKIAEGTTRTSGKLIFSEHIFLLGSFEFRAICGSCVTNIDTLSVSPAPVVNCIDSDGDDIFTFGWVDDVQAEVAYPDECYDADSVIEYVCEGGMPAAKIPQDCPTNYKCDGGRCILKTGYNLGDELFYYGKAWDSLDGGYSVDLHLEEIETGGPCHLGARIYRHWDYAVPGCEGSTGTVDWTLFDSNGFRWGVYDTSPTSQTVEICPCTWDGENLWYFEVVNTKTPNCPIEFEFDFDIFVCECD